MKVQKSTKTWTKTRKPNLLRHKSGRYYARAFASGKEVWKLLTRSDYSVARLGYIRNTSEKRRYARIRKDYGFGIISPVSARAMKPRSSEKLKGFLELTR